MKRSSTEDPHVKRLIFKSTNIWTQNDDFVEKEWSPTLDWELNGLICTSWATFNHSTVLCIFLKLISEHEETRLWLCWGEKALRDIQTDSQNQLSSLPQLPKNLAPALYLTAQPGHSVKHRGRQDFSIFTFLFFGGKASSKNFRGNSENGNYFQHLASLVFDFLTIMENLTRILWKWEAATLFYISENKREWRWSYLDVSENFRKKWWH